MAQMTLVEFHAKVDAKYAHKGVKRKALADADFDARKAEWGESFYYLPVNHQREVDGETISKTGTVFFKIFNEGQPGEYVIWEDTVLKDMLPRQEDNTFRDAVKEWYETNKGTLDPKVIKFVVKETDKENLFAILRVFEFEAGMTTEQARFVEKTGSTITLSRYTSM